MRTLVLAVLLVGCASAAHRPDPMAFEFRRAQHQAFCERLHHNNPEQVSGCVIRQWDAEEAFNRQAFAEAERDRLRAVEISLVAAQLQQLSAPPAPIFFVQPVIVPAPFVPPPPPPIQVTPSVTCTTTAGGGFSQTYCR